MAGGFRFEVSGDYRKLAAYLERQQRLGATIRTVMDAAGRRGVEALSSVTPVDSGRAAHSWRYEIQAGSDVYLLTWTNDDVENGFPVVIMLQYGHGTGTGGWVEGHDFINPAIRPIFDQIANDVWKVVTS